MSKFLKTSVFAVLLLFAALFPLHSQNTAGYDVFIPISKYISQGDSEKLSAWFADNLEVCIRSSSSTSSKSQARQILKSFFESNSPSSFSISHTAGQGSMKYALGTLKAGGDSFLVTVFVNLDGGEYKIQQIKIDPVN